MKLQSHRMIKASRNLQEFLAQEGNWIRIMKLSSTSQVRRIKYPLPSVPTIKLHQLRNSPQNSQTKKCYYCSSMGVLEGQQILEREPLSTHSILKLRFLS